MAGHPRIGERGLSAQSRQEQAAVGSDAGTIQALRDANAAYEDRFGHVFLICATGRGPDEILAELRRRMAHDPDTEREVAAAEIGKINALRLREAGRRMTSVSTHILDTSARPPGRRRAPSRSTHGRTATGSAWATSVTGADGR